MARLPSFTFRENRCRMFVSLDYRVPATVAAASCPVLCIRQALRRRSAHPTIWGNLVAELSAVYFTTGRLMQERAPLSTLTPQEVCAGSVISGGSSAVYQFACFAVLPPGRWSGR